MDLKDVKNMSSEEKIKLIRPDRNDLELFSVESKDYEYSIGLYNGLTIALDMLDKLHPEDKGILVMTVPNKNIIKSRYPEMFKEEE